MLQKWPVGLVVEKEIYLSLLNLFVVTSLVHGSQMQRILVKFHWNQILKWLFGVGASLESAGEEVTARRAGTAWGSHRAVPGCPSWPCPNPSRARVGSAQAVPNEFQLMGEEREPREEKPRDPSLAIS